MEEQLLPRADLKPAYDRAVWLYVYRDFSGNGADRAAERICLRLGMTSYPQHFLLDPATLERLADTGRAVDSFLAAVDRARVKRAPSLAPADRLREADARAEALERSKSVAAARRGIEDPDVLVRFRALEILAEKDPAPLVPRAEALLAEPNDPFRFLACEALGKAAKPAAAAALEAVVREPRDSLNPNVLRIRAAEALGACGDAGSVEVLAPHARAGWRNGLTGVAVAALESIAVRDPRARPAVRDALAAAYPDPPGEPSEERAVLALARKVHDALGKVTGKRVPFPDAYDAAARERLSRSWK